MNEYRAKANDLCMADAMPFHQHFEYRTTLPLDDALHDQFFLPVANNLRPGDEVTLVSYDRPPGPRHDARIVEIATVRVVEKGRDRVELHRIGDIERIPRRAVIDNEDPAPREAYVSGDGKAVWNVGARAYDIKVGGKVVASEPDKDKAAAMARGDIPLTA